MISQPRRFFSSASRAIAQDKHTSNGFVFRRLATTIGLLALIVGPLSQAVAADVLIEHRAVDVQSIDGMTFGLVEVVVRNVGSTPVTDLNLRSKSQTSQVLGNGVLHLGDIAPGAASIVIGRILVEAPSMDGATLKWSLECDECDPESGDSVESRGVADGEE